MTGLARCVIVGLALVATGSVTESTRPATPPAAPADALVSAAQAAAQLPRLRSLLVSRRGVLVLEKYFGGTRATKAANIKSASKSVVSALVGIAIERRLIAGPHQPITDFFPQIAKDRDARKRAITIEDLLTMRSGLESTSGRGYGAWVQSANWVNYALNRPLVDNPGTRVEYSTGNSHLLSAIVTKASRTSTWQFAQDHLARPLGFSLPRWPQDPQGIYFGGNDMLMTPRQMIRFGELYLNGGRVGDRQLLPGSWIDQSKVPRGRSRWGSDREYGYGWWIRTFSGRPGYYAWGYGGQFIFVVPDLQLVVVTTSQSDASRERRDHLDGIYDLMDKLVEGLGS